MCWLAEQFHPQCGHWGRRGIHTYCVKRYQPGGCSDIRIDGPPLHLDRACEACKYRESEKLIGVSMTFRQLGASAVAPFSNILVEQGQKKAFLDRTQAVTQALLATPPVTPSKDSSAQTKSVPPTPPMAPSENPNPSACDKSMPQTPARTSFS
jgi:hypothetical protein